MAQDQEAGLSTALWTLAIGAAVVGVVVVSLLPSMHARRAEAAAGAEAPADPPTPVDPEAALNAWAQFDEAATVLVRAEDVAELKGLMTKAAGKDNEAVGTETPDVVYVWCEDDGHEERDLETEEAEAAEKEHVAVFVFEVPRDGVYYPWARVWWEDSCGDSLFLGLARDDADPRSFTVQDGTHDWWHWLPVAGASGLALEQGAYRLTARNREDGARLSRVLLTTKGYSSYKPETPEG